MSDPEQDFDRRSWAGSHDLLAHMNAARSATLPNQYCDGQIERRKSLGVGRIQPGVDGPSEPMRTLVTRDHRSKARRDRRRLESRLERGTLKPSRAPRPSPPGREFRYRSLLWIRRRNVEKDWIAGNERVDHGRALERESIATAAPSELPTTTAPIVLNASIEVSTSLAGLTSPSALLNPCRAGRTLRHDARHATVHASVHIVRPSVNPWRKTIGEPLPSSRCPSITVLCSFRTPRRRRTPQ